MNNTAININPEDSVIILIEFQKTWTEKGIFYNLIKKEYQSRNVLQNTLFLLNTARSHNMEIIHVPFIIDKADKQVYKKIPFLPKFLKRFTQGTWKAEFTPGVYSSTDEIISGRYAFDATRGSNLEEVLIQKKYKNLLFCGFTTDHCVGETMDALEGGIFHCILVSDCTAAISKKKQKEMESTHISLTGKEITDMLKDNNRA